MAYSEERTGASLRGPYYHAGLGGERGKRGKEDGQNISFFNQDHSIRRDDKLVKKGGKPKGLFSSRISWSMPDEERGEGQKTYLGSIASSRQLHALRKKK